LNNILKHKKIKGVIEYEKNTMAFKSIEIEEKNMKIYVKMKGKILSSIIIILMVDLVFFAGVSSSESFNRTIYVDDDGDADYTRIQDAIDAASDGDNIYVYSGIYIENILVNKQLVIEGENRDTAIIDGGEADSVVTISADEVSISDFTITNSKNSSRSAGISISADCASISDCIIVRNLGYGVYCEGSNDHLIVGNIVDRNNYDGICLISSSGNRISDNIITDHFYWVYRIGQIPRSHGVYLYNVADSTIINNIFRNNINTDLSLISSSSLSILDNRFHGGSGIILLGDLDEMTSHTIENNFVNDKPIYYFKNDHNGRVVPSDAGEVILADCQNFRIADLDVDGGDYCILLGYSSHNIIEDNVISNVMDGFYLWHSDYNIISGNMISNAFGNPSESSSFNIISDNIIKNNIRYGIGLFSSDNNTVYQNKIYNNSENGIIIVESRDNIVSLNEINDNSQSGINLYMSPSNTVTGNTLSSNNEYGIKSESSSNNNLIHHNNFYNNTPDNARDSCRNTWYLEGLGGNYWDDYDGNDLNNDSFGDQPYSIRGGSNSDNYPLIQPISIYYPDKPDKPIGPTSGKIREEQTFVFHAIDPKDCMLYYLVDWGDGSEGIWMGHFPSGDDVEVSHTWMRKGDYVVRVKVKNIIGAESEWSDPLSISMPKNKLVHSGFFELIKNHPFLFPLFRIFLNLKGVI